MLQAYEFFPLPLYFSVPFLYVKIKNKHIQKAQNPVIDQTSLQHVNHLLAFMFLFGIFHFSFFVTENQVQLDDNTFESAYLINFACKLLLA